MLNERDILGTIIPHSAFGDPDCCGCLDGIVRGDHAEIVCNECGSIVRTVPKDQLRKTLSEMELKLDVATAECPNCGVVNLFPGLSEVYAFICRGCGQGVAV